MPKIEPSYWLTFILKKFELRGNFKPLQNCVLIDFVSRDLFT